MVFGATSIFEEEFWAIHESLGRLLRSTNANTVLLIDKAGQLITSAGNTTDLDLSSFSSLSAADYAATSQLASLVGEREFSTIFHQGERENIYISVVGQKVILAVVFDSSSTLGLVRVRVRQAAEELTKIFSRIFNKVEEQSREPYLDESFTKEAEDELDRLLG
ncbi:hypothetical protein AMJ40_04130 [candidate division TA06 bacterium DG_26]|uniref:Roadblock/LAMTOR2 domain-containing protein n=1 Tax=candidate division TA06 bacterium DG_26 TaxID=1703771 RepID=A0A0S7WIQ5_UNCT6|nr:MAG: hypothetical protein AMJ40_04130 [candidate division TA06 bacterium DG_26]